MTEEINNISQIIRSTEEYSDVCDICRDEILLYPTISGRTEYSQDEVEQITLKRIIDKLRAKEQECEEYKKKFSRFFNIDNQECWDIAFLNKEKAKYKQALDEIRKIIVKMQTKTILTFPDFTREENLKGVMKQCYSGYIEILNIINEAKGENNG